MLNSYWPSRGSATRMMAAAGAAVLLAAMAASAASAQPAQADGHGGPVHIRTHAAVSRPAPAAPVRSVTPFGDGPPGFWFGTDSLPITMSGSAPYKTPAIGGDYGGYIGMTGSWSAWQGCQAPRGAWSPTNAADANTNFTNFHMGIGTGVYWFMGGPGVDPHYNGSTSEAFSWGEAQAARTLFDISHVTVKYPIVFMDVELPGIAPAPDNGWNDVYTSTCSGKVKASFISPTVDRSELNGYAAYLTGHSSYKVGVYSAPSVWTAIFGTGSESSIPNTYEWTYNNDTSSLSHPPLGWCLRTTSNCADFFGGVTEGSPYAVMWQWTCGGGTFNGVGDFDQIDANRTP
ncbi:MAG TPA: hypothetical protein VGI31_02545 [Streptosporangiaceae bacterium]